MPAASDSTSITSPPAWAFGVRDDGSTFAPDGASVGGETVAETVAETDGGHGIRGMRDRALALSGRFTAGAGPSGFEVSCVLPTPEAGTRAEPSRLPGRSDPS